MLPIANIRNSSPFINHLAEFQIEEEENRINSIIKKVKYDFQGIFQQNSGLDLKVNKKMGYYDGYKGSS